MTKLCESLIKKDIDFNCADLISRGVEPDGKIMNRSDVDFAKCVFDDTRKNIVKQLILKTGKKAYDVVQYGGTPFNGVKSTLNVGTYHNTWTHEIPIVVLNNSPEVTEDIIDGLANGTFVLVLRNRHKGTDGEAEYQIYGYDQGLVASAGENDKWSEDTDGGWLMTMQEQRAPRSAMFLWNSDSETTAAQYESLSTTKE